MVNRCLQGGVFRYPGLDHDLPRSLPSPGPPRDLGHKAKASFRRPEIRLVKSGIRIQNPDQRNPGEIQTFRHHLRSEKDVELATAEIAQHAFVILPPHHRVPVHAGDAHPGE